MVVYNNNINKLCSYCLKLDTSVTCSSCSYIKYCSQACQEADKKEHQAECSEKIKEMTWETRSMIRVIAAQEIKSIDSECEIFGWACDPSFINRPEWIEYFYPIFENYVLCSYSDLGDMTYENF